MRLRRTISNFLILHHCVQWHHLLNLSGSLSTQWKVRPMTYVNLQWRKKAEVRNAQPYASDCVGRLERNTETRLLSEENKVVVTWKQQTELPNKMVLIHGLMILEDNSEKSPAPRIILGYSFDVCLHYHIHVIMTMVTIFLVFLFYLNCYDSRKQQKKEVVVVVSTFYLSF